MVGQPTWGVLVQLAWEVGQGVLKALGFTTPHTISTWVVEGQRVVLVDQRGPVVRIAGLCTAGLAMGANRAHFHLVLPLDQLRVAGVVDQVRGRGPLA